MKPAHIKAKDSMNDEAKVIVLWSRFPERKKRHEKSKVNRCTNPVSEETRAFDPLVRAVSKRNRLLTGLKYGLLAFLLQVATVYLLVRIGEAQDSKKDNTISRNVFVSIPEPATPKDEPLETPIAEEPEPEAAVEAITESPIIPEQIPERPKKIPNKPAEKLQADPVNAPESPKTDEPPARRVVGLNFESTVTGGSGPSYAVGNTRMGETGKRAEDPSSIKSIPGSTKKPKADNSTENNSNQVAAVIPTEGISLVRPKRLSEVTPDYPSVLRAQGLEGDVAVLVRISPEGAILEVKVVKGSGYPAFDESAKLAAQKERFSPALRNQVPIEYTLKYTYRFRISN